MVGRDKAFGYALVACFVAFFAGSYWGRELGAEPHEAVYQRLTPSCKADVTRVMRNLDQAQHFIGKPRE